MRLSVAVASLLVAWLAGLGECFADVTSELLAAAVGFNDVT